VPTSVVNPAASPVLTSSVDDPGRIAYSSIINNQACDGQSVCTTGFPNVPKGGRLVVQHVSGALALTGTPSSVALSLFSTSTETTIFFFAPFIGSVSLFDQPTLLYFDAGAVPVLSYSVAGSNFSSNLVTLTGYLLDCTASPCAPIAH
jgi:hypothetical protein